METMKETVSFLDKEGHRARLNVSITDRNGYHEFTVSGQFMGGSGQCLDRIRPANADQAALINLWKEYHLKDVSGIEGFDTRLAALLERIREAEAARPAEKLEGDDLVLARMKEEGIGEDMLDAVKAYIALYSIDDLSDFQESYCGEYPSDEAFAEDMADQLGAVDRDASWPNNHIDWKAAARDLMHDYSEQDGYYFRNI